VKAYLSRGGFADSSFFDAVEAEGDELAARVRAACLSMPEPKPTDIFGTPYAEGSPLVDEERASFEEYLAGFDDNLVDDAAAVESGGR
jgi:pyruvate dehydrogenase E1 component alpha subunit